MRVALAGLRGKARVKIAYRARYASSVRIVDVL
jgi:hypothetical protein